MAEVWRFLLFYELPGGLVGWFVVGPLLTRRRLRRVARDRG